MTDENEEARALRPLWLLSTGAGIGALSTLSSVEPPAWLPSLLLVIGLLAVAGAVCWKRDTRYELWFLAGLALVCGRGLSQTGHHLELARMIADGETTVRAQAVVVEGWTDARWGHRTRAQVVAAEHNASDLGLPKRCRLEVRGPINPGDLPIPGTEIDILARIRGQPRSPLLVISSWRLIQPTGERRLLPSVRNRLAHNLLLAAGTDANRIRTAEMAAALALGRRDLIPKERRDHWRRSGLAHLLAVSGLHVGLVGGFLWLTLALIGAGPRATRLTVLVALPAYALLAGAAPSAMRAALMAAIYLSARLLGRAIIPMAAVLLAVTTLLVAQPELIANAGFQLTVVITAALIRWVPTLSTALFGPRWITGAVAVPVVAQIAAAPIVAWHFRTAIPGALIANLLALPLLAPTILGSVAATVIAPLWRTPAAFGLDCVNLLLVLLRFVSAPARIAEWVTPPIPVVASVLLVIAGWTALQSRHNARFGAVTWICLLSVLGVFGTLPAPTTLATVELLPVSDGASVIVSDGGDTIMADAGRYPRESAQFFSAGGGRKLAAVIASHTDEDHLGGLGQVLRSFDVERLLIPAWMLTERQVVPLLRSARRRGVLVQPVVSGTAVRCGSIRLEILWPPFRNPPRSENERSLVARAITGGGSVLLTADIGGVTEARLVAGGPLKSAILIAPHHGGRTSTSPALLGAVEPAVALIPAAPGNTHGHPHSEVLDRLAERHIPLRYPARDGRCGARWTGERWVPFP